MNNQFLELKLRTIMTSIFIFMFSLQIVFAGDPITNKKNGIIDISTGWKFQTGDNLKWAEADFDDSKWDEIPTDYFWEKNEKYAKYDGYAWYRIKVLIPSSLIDNAFYKDSLQFIIGHLDDTDQTFLNGKLIGQNGKTISENSGFSNDFIGDPKAYKIVRKYVLPANDSRILWDQENTIAIRINDDHGLGGMNNSSPSISMINLKDFLKILPKNSSFKFSKNGEISKDLTIKNEATAEKYVGQLRVEIVNPANNEKIFETSKNVSIEPGQSEIINYAFTAPFSKPYLAYYEFIENKTEVSSALVETIPYILTPRSPEKPQINGPKVFGVRPGAPFLYTIPVSGKMPIKYEVESLPLGLVLNSSNGVITGSIDKLGEYELTFKAENEKGKATRKFKIVVGDNIALTPPLGWNSWNCWGISVTGANIREAADFMKSSGLINHGWTYINIDDGWEAGRTSKGEIESNDKFPDMKILADYVHEKGLKIGIYSSPGTKTCGGYIGSYQHEIQDAQTFGKWGIDFLKYDWCSYKLIAKDSSLYELKKPYFIMRDALDKVNRDIVYSLCQYGRGEVWKWGAEVGGNLWRTETDIMDTWYSMSFVNGFSQYINSDYSAPGQWNDPDMMVLGQVGWGPELNQTRLTVDEQYTHVSLWAQLSAPLLLGCDLSQLDDFTLSLLTNDEVLAINQDVLGKQAKPIFRTDEIQIWVKELEDGSKSVGLYNLTKKSQKIDVKWSDLNMDKKLKVRDSWRQKDLGVFEDGFEKLVPPHGVVLIKVEESN